MRYLLYLLLSFLTFSCAIEKAENTLYEKKLVDPSISEAILLDNEVLEDSSFVIDKYPISGTVEVFNNQEKIITPRPKQLFSAASSSEIRLHKLGEIRWIYLGQEPSAAWPMTMGFLDDNNDLGIDSFDVNSGTINSKIFKHENVDSKFVFKIERGLQQSSSEIFVSQLKRINSSWQIISSDESRLDELTEEFYEYLSSSGPSTGTSLVALNLNATNKTEVITDDITGLSKIKLKINFPRAWAALRRSLLLAGFEIIDEDRNEGKFYLEYSVRRSLLDRRSDITSIEIIVKELSSKECLISTSLDAENLDLSEEIISQINQSLS